MNNNDLTLNQAQKQVDEWITTIGVRYFSELTNLALLMEEVGELSRLMARKYGEQSFKTKIKPEDVDLMIRDELGDVVFVLVCLANQMNIDLESVIHDNLAKKTNRDNQRHHTNPKLIKTT